jgi:hypothetical protein
MGFVRFGTRSISGVGQAAKNAKRAELVGSSSASGPFLDRRGLFSLGPIAAIVPGGAGGDSRIA